MKNLSEADVKKMKVTELKAALKERGLPQSGKKDDLVKTLMKNINVNDDDCADMNLVNSVNDAELVKSPELVISEQSPSASTIPNDEGTNSAIFSSKTLNFDEDVSPKLNALNPEKSSNLINIESNATEVEENTIKTAVAEAIMDVESTVISILPEESTVETKTTDLISETPAVKHPETPGSEISALWSSATAEDEEDDEQKELREVEEKKLREAVKKSMANPAVKKGNMTMEKSKLTTPSSLSSSSTSSSVSNSTHTHTTSYISNSSSVTTVSYSNSTPHSDKSNPPPLLPPATTTPSTTTTTTTSNPISKHLRIDNFQRPLNITSLGKWLEEQSGLKIPIGNIWLNSIKTHCYIDFESEIDAALCRSTINDLQFPASNPLRLKADYTNVSAKEAPESVEAKLPPGQWMKASSIPDSSSSSEKKSGNDSHNHRIEVVSEPVLAADGTTVPVEGSQTVSPRQAVKRKINNENGMMNVLRTAAVNAANSAIRTDNMVNIVGNEDVGFSTRKFREGSNATATGGGGSGSGGATSGTSRSNDPRVVGGPVKRNRDYDVSEEQRPENAKRPLMDTKATTNTSSSRENRNDVHHEKEEVKVISLETLFRKTISTPHLFWLPVSEEEVQRRIKLRAL